MEKIFLGMGVLAVTYAGAIALMFLSAPIEMLGRHFCIKRLKLKDTGQGKNFNPRDLIVGWLIFLFGAAIVAGVCYLIGDIII